MSTYQKGKIWCFSFKRKGRWCYQGGFKSEIEARNAELALKDQFTGERGIERMFMESIKEFMSPDGKPGRDMKFGELYKRCKRDWEATLSPHWVKEKTLIIEKHYLPRWRDRICSEISRENVERILYARHKDFPAGAVARNDLKIIRALFRAGNERKWIDSDPTREIKKKSFKTRRVRCLHKPSELDIRKMVDAAKGEEKDILIALVSTASRWGGITSLTWDAIDFENRKIRLLDAKTPEGDRETILDINDDLMRVLRRQQQRHSNSEYVFPSPQGGRRVDASKLMTRVCERAGIERYNVHALRHFAISYAYNQGATFEEGMLLAGHSDPKVHKGYIYRLGIKRTPTDLLNFGFRADSEQTADAEISKLKFRNRKPEKGGKTNYGNPAL
jgi:integrase